MTIQSRSTLISPEIDLNESQATLQVFQANAQRLLKEMLLSTGGLMPSDEAVQIAAKMMAAKAARELKSKS